MSFLAAFAEPALAAGIKESTLMRRRVGSNAPLELLAAARSVPGVRRGFLRDT